MNRFEQLETRNLLAVLTVNTNNDNTTSDAFLTLREGLFVVNAGTSTGVIPGLGRVLSAGETAQVNTTIPLGTTDKIDLSGVATPINLSSELPVDSSVIIDGPGPALVIDAQNTSRVFNISAGAVDVTIQDLTLTGGVAPAGQDGGAIISNAAGLLTISGSTITGNVADQGGGIYATGDVLLTAVKLGDGAGGTGNDATNGDGGGIKALGAVTITNNSSVTGNTSTLDGGGVYSATNIIIENSTVGGSVAGLLNTSGRDGGGLYARANITATNSTISGNTAADDGGGLYTATGTVSLLNSTVGGSAALAPNKANDDGGGIYARNITSQNSTISGNEAGDDGGGIFSRTTATIRNSTISGNKAKDDGGGIQGFNVTVQNATIASNKADSDALVDGNGGGIFATNRLTIQNSVVVGNTDNLMTDPDIRPATITNVRFSLIGDKRGTTLVATGPTTPDPVTGNLIGDATVPANNILITQVLQTAGGNALLQNNNGVQPTTTETVALIAGSVALDKGSNSLVANANLGDQRGLPFVRIFGTRVDMGAFEIQTDAPEINVRVNGTDVATGGTAADVGSISGTFLIPVTIRNDGTAALTLTLPITTAGGNAGDFVVTQPGVSSIPAGGSTTFNVAFTPSANGLRTTTLTIPNNDSNESPYTLTLQGTGAGVVVTNAEINLKVTGVTVLSGGTAANVGSTNGAIPVTVTIENFGTDPLNLTGSPFVTKAGTNPGDFTVTQPSTSTIAAGGSATFTITFMPTANGTRSATFSIANNDTSGGENPYTFTLDGTGSGVVAAPEINVQVDGADIVTGGTKNFGTTATTITKTFTIQNVGAATLNLTGVPNVVVSGTNASEFVVTVQPTTPVAAAGSTTFTVVFTPTANGNRTATLSISNDDTTSGENPYTIILQGSGTGFASALPYSNNGVADPGVFVPQTGTWTFNNNEIQSSRTPGTNAVATLNLGALPAGGVTVDTTVRMNPINKSASARAFSNAFIVFDYVDALNFKIAGIEAANDLLVISQVVGGVYSRFASRSAKFSPGTNYQLHAVITGTSVTVTAGGKTLTNTIGGNLLDGPVGLATINANTTFDNISVTA